jgi:rod shape-determining protein MreD
MTLPAQRGVVLAIMVFAATMAQMVLADSITVRGAQPDLLLLTTLVGALFCNANQGAQLGFWCGLIHASIASPPHSGFGSLIVSRTLVGFAVGWLEERIFRDNLLLALALTAVGTALAQAIFYVFAPQHHAIHWAHAMVATTLYNLMLAGPAYLIVHRLLGAPHQSGG